MCAITAMKTGKNFSHSNMGEPFQIYFLRACYACNIWSKSLYHDTHYMPENGWSGSILSISSPFLSSGVPVLSSYSHTKFNICEIVFICYYSCVLCFKRKVCRSSALMDTFTYAVKKYNFSVVFIVETPCTDCPHTQIAKFLSWYETVSEMVRPDHFRMCWLLLASSYVFSSLNRWVSALLDSNYHCDIL